VRELILDDMLPRDLAAELCARGRPARTLAELGLAHAADRDAASVDGVLVTADEATARDRPPQTTVALVAARPGPARREAVHRHAHEMAAQRPGSSRRYG
jgi:hypothetical protein